MKHIKILIMLISIYMLSAELNAQEFSFPLFFEDAIGNRDTLILGFDSNATDSIDADFGEINIVDQTWNDIFDVRAGEVKYYGIWEEMPPTYNSKKQIINRTCDFEHKINIVLYCSNFPLVIKWDTSLFTNNNCTKGSLLSNSPFFGWDTPFDEKFLSPQFFAFTTDSLVIGDDIPFMPLYHFFDEGKDIIMLWLTFADTTTLPPLSIHQISGEDNLLIYPNPSNNELNIKINTIENDSKRIMIYNVLGRLVFESEKLNLFNNQVRVNTTSIKAGLYYVRLIQNNKIITVKKWIKISN